MIVRYGRAVEEGFLSVYSVDTMEEARALLVRACPTNQEGEFFAPELARNRTIKTLFAFGERLREVHQNM